MSNPKEANYRIVRYNGEYMIEVLDKAVGHWYVVASHIKELWQAVELCNKYEQCDIEDDGIIGKDYIPVDWVERLEEYGVWEIVRKVEKLTTEDIKRIFDIETDVIHEITYDDNGLPNIGEEDYYKEIIKRYNNDK